MNTRWLALLKPADGIVIALALALLAGLWIGLGSSERGWVVAVTRASGSDFEVPAWTQQELRIDGPLGITRIEIDNGRARVVASPCEQKICILAGWLEHTGETAACVPNRVAISLLAADNRFDAVNF